MQQVIILTDLVSLNTAVVRNIHLTLFTLLIFIHRAVLKTVDNPYDTQLYGMHDKQQELFAVLHGFASAIEGDDVFVDTLNGRLRGKRRNTDSAAGL